MAISKNKKLSFPNKRSEKLVFADFFSGMGGFHQGIKEVCNAECAISCEIDKLAVETYKKNHHANIYHDDIKKKIDFPKVDILCAGFPCQAFTVIGHQLGFKDEKGTIFYNLVKVINKNLPKVILLENVRWLLSHDKGKTFEKMKKALSKNYSIYHKVLSSKDFGIPQHRQRVYIVGFLNDRKKSFKFPEGKVRNYNLVKWLDKGKIDNKCYHHIKQIAIEIKKMKLEYGFAYQYMYANFRKVASGVFPTLLCSSKTTLPIIKDKKGARTLTASECLRIQGFKRSFKMLHLSEARKYYQIGNSVSPPVIKSIVKNIVEYCNWNQKLIKKT